MAIACHPRTQVYTAYAQSIYPPGLAGQHALTIQRIDRSTRAAKEKLARRAY